MKLTYISNSIHGGPKLINEAGETVFKSDYAEDCRTHCEDTGIAAVEFDADGNGSIVSLPVEWIGDGGKLENSPRVIALIK